jgi:hypothetical protein
LAKRAHSFARNPSNCLVRQKPGGTIVASGVYILQVKANEKVVLKRIAVIR